MTFISFKNRILSVTLCLIFSQLMLTTSWAGTTEKRILVTPFEITSEENLDYLKLGIEKMLEARLTEPGKSKVLFSKDTQGNTDIDYIIKGTILIFGKQVSTDVQLLKADSGNVELSFNQMGEQKGDVIKHINLFAGNIRTRTLGLAPVQGLAAPAPAQYSAYQAAGKPIRPQEIWRGPFIKKEIKSINVADLDNDGKNETLILSNKMLEIYRRNQEGLIPVSENKLDTKSINHLFVDTIDIDHDGKKEICITGINTTQLRPSSSIYRVENMHLVKMLGPVNYFLRVVDTINGPMLLGQKTSGADARKLKTPVVELALGPDGDSLVRGEHSFSYADNVFGIAFGDFLNNGNQSTAVLGLDGLISLYSSEGTLIYKSSDTYGGTKNFIEYKGMRYNQQDGFKLSRIFLQQRLFAGDIDGDGKTNLIAVQNHDDASGLLSQTRLYSKSNIDVLTWNKLGLIIQDRGQTLTGYVSDFTLADMDTDGNKEIVFSVVSPTKILEDTRSQIFSKR